MIPWRLAVLKILCGILMLQLAFSGSRAWAVDGSAPPPNPVQISHTQIQFPQDIQRILQKIQRCVDLPVCENREIPADAQLSIRSGFPATCSLTAEEEARLRDYFAELNVQSNLERRIRIGANVTALAAANGLIVYAAVLFLFAAWHQHYSTLSAVVSSALVSIIGVLAMIGSTYFTIGPLLSVTGRNDVNRSLHALGVDPRNVEMALARIPRRSWLRPLFSSVGNRLTQGPRAARFRNGLPRFLRRTAAAAAQGSPGNSASSRNISNAIPTSESGTSSVTGTNTSTNTNSIRETADPSTGVRVCVPREEVEATASTLSDELLDTVEAGAQPNGRPGTRTRRVHSETTGITDTGFASSPQVIAVPTSSTPPPRPRRVLRDPRSPNPGAFSDANNFTRRALSETPAVLPAAGAATGAGAAETFVPIGN